LCGIELAAARCIPQLDQFVFAGAGEPLAVGAEGETVNDRAVTRRKRLLAVGDVETADRSISTGSEDHLSVAAHEHGRDLVLHAGKWQCESQRDFLNAACRIGEQ